MPSFIINSGKGLAEKSWFLYELVWMDLFALGSQQKSCFWKNAPNYLGFIYIGSFNPLSYKEIV